MTKARRLTEAGIHYAVKFLDDVRNKPGAPLQVPESLLFDATFSRPMPNAPRVEHTQFVTRRDAAEYLSWLYPVLGEDRVDDWAFWSWMGMYHFRDVIFNRERLARFATSASGKGQTEQETIILEPGKRSYYRHYLRSAWLINRRYGERCAILLDQDIMALPLIARLTLNSIRAFNSVGVVPLVMELYTSEKTQKTGLTSGGGNIYRLFHVLDQLECTYDVYGMSTEALIKILPAEFDRWKPRSVMA